MKKLILILMISILILTTGCWDMVEINQRIFPYSIGVDLNNGKEGEYTVTISYLNINAIGKNATQQERVFIITTDATSIFEATKKLSTIVPYPFYLKHLRVLILGESVSKEENRVRQIVDGLSRDFIINKKLLIATSHGKAEDILRAVPMAAKQEAIEGTIFSLLHDTRTSARFTPKSLTDFIQDMDRGAATVPRIKIQGENLKVFEGCIFKDYKMVGHIGEIENRGIALLNNDVDTEMIDVEFNDTTLSYELTGQNVKRKLIQDGENIKIKIDIETEGVLQEYVMTKGETIDNEGIIMKMEKSIGRALEKEINNVLEIVQKEYKADAIGIGEYISKYHPNIWRGVSKDWDEVFSEIDIEVNVDSKLRRRGLIK